MHDCGNILDDIAKETCNFRLVHPYITIHSVECLDVVLLPVENAVTYVHAHINATP